VTGRLRLLGIAAGTAASASLTGCGAAPGELWSHAYAGIRVAW
jgi:hypothetical protein